MGALDLAAVWIPAAGVAVALAAWRPWLPFAVAGSAVVAFVATVGYALNHWEDYPPSRPHVAQIFDWVDATAVG